MAEKRENFRGNRRDVFLQERAEGSLAQEDNSRNFQDFDRPTQHTENRDERPHTANSQQRRFLQRFQNLQLQTAREERYTCGSCHRSFKTDMELQSHLPVHEKCYCLKCENARGSAIQQIDVTRIGDVKICDNCKTLWYTTREYESHSCCIHINYKVPLLKLLPILFDCRRCGGFFNSCEQYEKHDCPPTKVKLMPKCSWCFYTFNVKFDIVNHMIEEHGRCPHCHKECLSREQMVEHLYQSHY